SSSVKHSLKSYSIASSGVPNHPEFMAVSVVDDIQVTYCDGSNKIYEPRQDWMKKLLDDNPQLWTRVTQDCFEFLPPFFKIALNSFIQLSNHSEGVHILQSMIGCEWDEMTGEVTGFTRYHYDREDFIELDLKTSTWTALRPEADIIKQKWDEDTPGIKEAVEFLTQTCPELLKLNLKYGNNSLLRTDVPSVSLLQKTPSSPVSCHATGFYPDRALMFWRKDREEIHEGVEHGEILPNHDGSFQMNIDLNISSVSPEDWRRYDCVFHLPGVEDDIFTKLDETQIRTNWVEKSSNQTSTSISIIIISAVVVVVVVVFAAAAGFMVHRTKRLHLISESSLRLSFFRGNMNEYGVHILQLMHGCEWDEETGDVTGFMQYGYDGEDFILVDMKKLKWIALKPQAMSTKLKWDSDKARIKINEQFFTQTCPEWLKMYLHYGKSSLLRTGHFFKNPVLSTSGCSPVQLAAALDSLPSRTPSSPQP
ncbi:major histocompatibility complex class I-related gene protein-like, partial [Mugil cephalus]|uniref:major histocompatibility complex class I-related gene protein-like n=1 Tax=Mugil cephalus TaxID=48193 RepID=UPI001FB780B0